MAFCQAVKSYNSLVRVPLQRSHWPHNRGADPDLAHKLSGLEFLGFDTQSRKIAICIWTNLTEFNSWLKLCITVIYGAPKVSVLNEYIIMKYIWIKCAKSLGFSVIGTVSMFHPLLTVRSHLTWQRCHHYSNNHLKGIQYLPKCLTSPYKLTVLNC